MNKSLIKYEISVFDIEVALLNIKKENIIIYNLEKKDDYKYTFLASFYTKNRLKNLFPNIKIIKEVGIYHIIYNFLHYKTTLISLIASILLFFLLSDKIWKIEVTGDNTSYYPIIYQTLKDNNIKPGISKIENSNLSILEEKILYQLNDKIEWIEIRNSGAVLNVKFLKRRLSSEKVELKGNLYATKDGVIVSFDLSSGEKVVKVNDYVKKGDLLVKDVVTTDYNEDIYVGTLGCVYAYTWYTVETYIEIDEKSSYDETQVFVNLLLRAKEIINQKLTINESIYQESVLLFKKNGKIVSMKVHFTCIEDITKE